ncbi:hypothetical protein LTR17_010962 [Elasticomyces elasticus]|nr:hypothetical protein LTR17_010962 [Elasticomyces elasticus]
MAPIPVHIDAPITPIKAQGITPQTAASDPVVPSPATNVATTTAPPHIGGYEPARPGVTPAGPTPFIASPQPSATRTTYTPQNENQPPPPQPGAVPMAPFSQQATQTAGSGLPPPPKAGESVKQGTAFTSSLNTMFSAPPPRPLNQNYAPTHSTSTVGTMPGQATSPIRSAPTTLNFGPVASPSAGGYQDTARRVSSEHPPGYVQNQYAQELSPQQRASLEQETRRESFVDRIGLGAAGVGGGETIGGERRASEAVGGAWDAAKGWFNKAGTAIAEGEQEVWRRINGRQ